MLFTPQITSSTLLLPRLLPKSHEPTARGHSSYSTVPSNLLGNEPTSELTEVVDAVVVMVSPDKNQGVKNIQERFARLGTIAGILRDAEKRKR